MLASRGQHLFDGQISHLSTCPRLPPEPHGSHDRHNDMTVTWAPVLGCLLQTRGQLHWTSVQVILVRQFAMIRTPQCNSRNGPDQIRMIALADFSPTPVKHDYHKLLHTSAYCIPPSRRLLLRSGDGGPETKRPAWTQEYSVHVCSITAAITIQFQCQHVVAADCTCKMELLLSVSVQNLPRVALRVHRAQVDHGPASRETAKLPCANLQRSGHTCHGTRSPIRPISDLSQTYHLAKHFI